MEMAMQSGIVVTSDKGDNGSGRRRMEMAIGLSHDRVVVVMVVVLR